MVPMVKARIIVRTGALPAMAPQGSCAISNDEADMLSSSSSSSSAGVDLSFIAHDLMCLFADSS